MCQCQMKKELCSSFLMYIYKKSNYIYRLVNFWNFLSGVCGDDYFVIDNTIGTILVTVW